MKKTIVICVSVLILLAIAAAYSILVYLSKDDPPPNDADLRLERLNIPDKENAFTYFELAGENVYELPEIEGEEGQTKFYAMMRGEAWDEELAERVLNGNEKAFEYLEQGLECTKIEFPELKAGFASPLPALSRWRRVGKLKALQGGLLFRRGNEAEAFEAYLAVFKFGQMVENGRGALIPFILGEGIKNDGLDCIRAYLPKTTLEPEELLACCDTLREYEDDSQGLADSMRIEYMVRAGEIDSFAQGRGNLGSELQFTDGVFWVTNHGYFFKPNGTKTLLAKFFRAGIDDITRPPAEWAAPKLFARVRLPGVASFLFRPNGVGRASALLLLPPFTKSSTRRLEIRAELSATRLLIALKCYKMRTGKLPQTLDALVPDYIDKIPADNFDGQPMRYSAEKKLIYSVGEDLQDDGGDAEKDIIFEIEF